ncbi:MAG: C25 family cysteine peptidase [Muribaculaceae bacterium]|nr:C25 family cysteine peptidase [Muribaculaceae bacterium]
MHFKLKATLFAMLLTALPFSEQAAAEAGFASASVLSDGRWVKVRVDHTGVYRISHSTLRLWGFSNPSSVSIAGYGSVERAHSLDTAPDDLPAIPVVHGSDAIYFYGEGASRVTPGDAGSDPLEHRNYYSSSSYYFLTEGSSSLRSPEIESINASVSDSESAIDSHIEIDRRRYLDFHPYSTGAFYFSRNIADNPLPVTETWKTAGVYGPVEISFQYIGYPTSQAVVAPTLTVEGATYTDMSSSGIALGNTENLMYLSSSTVRHQLKNVGNEVSATITDPAKDFSVLALDHMTLITTKSNDFNGSPELWDFSNVAADTPLSISTMEADIDVWDVTTPLNPVKIIPSTVADGKMAIRTINGGNTRLALFSRGSSVPEPVYEGVVAPQNLHSLSGIDMLIVSSDMAVSEAERLAEAHRQYQGMKVAVVTQEQIFNEFSSGAYHPNALRHLNMMLAGRGLSHVLLIGTGQPKPLAPGEELAANVAVTFHTEYPDEDRYNSRDHSSDQYFGILSDRIEPRLAVPDMKISLNVGRAPVRNLAEAKAFVDKCIRYLADPSEAGRTAEAIIFTGYGDTNGHLESGRRQADAIKRLLPGATIHQGYHSRFPSIRQSKSPLQLSFIKSRLSGQPRFMNYSGHATNAILDMDFTLGEALTVDYGSSPIIFMAGCRSGWFDRPTPSLGVVMAVAERGPIVAIGTAREVYMSNNHVFNNFFTEYLFSAKPGQTIGEIFTKALNNSHNQSTSAATRDQMLNNLLFNFLGDPAMPCYAPSGIIDTSLPETSTSPSLEPFKIQGTVKGNNGKTDTSFNGRIEVTLYAPEKTVVTCSPDASDVTEGAILLNVDDDEILSASADVTAGKWSVTIIPPAMDNPGLCRMNMHAISSDRRVAYGAYQGLTITDPISSTSAISDNEAPEISLMLDSPEVTAAGVTGTEPVMILAISDKGSGVMMNRSSIGAIPTVSIDGKTVSGLAYALRSASDGTYTLTHPLGPLQAGHHRLEVSARDNAGNTGHSYLDFKVEGTPMNGRLSTSTKIARDGVDLFLTHDAESAPETTLLILDSAGETVHTVRNATFPYHWDLRLPDGTPAPDGTYHASALLAHPGRNGSTPSVEFIIVH